MTTWTSTPCWPPPRFCAGGCGTQRGRALLAGLDDICRRRRLSPGGSGDVLAAAVFVDGIDKQLTSAEE